MYTDYVLADVQDVLIYVECDDQEVTETKARLAMEAQAAAWYGTIWRWASWGYDDALMRYEYWGRRRAAAPSEIVHEPRENEVKEAFCDA